MTTNDDYNNYFYFCFFYSSFSSVFAAAALLRVCLGHIPFVYAADVMTKVLMEKLALLCLSVSAGGRGWSAGDFPFPWLLDTCRAVSMKQRSTSPLSTVFIMSSL